MRDSLTSRLKHLNINLIALKAIKYDYMLDSYFKLKSMAFGDFPLPKFHFQVMIDGIPVGCSEVTGLDCEFESVEYRSGADIMGATTKRIGLRKNGQVTLKRGISSLSPAFMLLFQAGYTTFAYTPNTPLPPLVLIIQLLDEYGAAAVTWTVADAVPVKLEGASLKADDNSIAFESLVFEHSGILVTPF